VKEKDFVETKLQKTALGRNLLYELLQSKIGTLPKRRFL